MREYSIPGPNGDMTVMLSDEDAKARGLTPAAEVAPPKAKQPANKQAAPSNKAASAPQSKNAG